MDRTLSQNANARDYKIDILRVLGTLLVILAHVNPPSMLSKIRTFDVVMLVMISGMSFVMSKPIKYGEYVVKRIKRLVVPTYALITFLFIGFYLACAIIGREQIYSPGTMIKSYAFYGGIGFIWIVKVYLITALVSPLLKRFSDKIKNDWVFLAVLFLAYGIYHILFEVISDTNINKKFLYEYFFSIIPYCLIAIIGIRIVGRKDFLYKCCFVFATLSVVFMLIYNGFEPQKYKYPPQTLYLTYGTAIATVLYIIIPNKTNKVIQWTSKNSFSIYLWHIIALEAFYIFTDFISIPLVKTFYFQYAFVLGFSITATLVWNMIYGSLVLNFKNKYRKKV